MLSVQPFHVGNGQIEVHLLRNRPFGPGDSGQLGHLLKRDPVRAGRIPQDKPIATPGIRMPGWRRFITRPVLQAEQLAVELAQASRIRCVQYDLKKSWETPVSLHASQQPKTKETVA